MKHTTQREFYAPIGSKTTIQYSANIVPWHQAEDLGHPHMTRFGVGQCFLASRTLHAITQVGSFVFGRKTIKKRMRAKLKAVKMEPQAFARPHCEDRILGEVDPARASELLRSLEQ